MASGSVFYQKRMELARTISDNINSFTTSMLVVGSNAYNPDLVSEKSDLDFIAVVDFKRTDFDAIESKLGVELNKNAVKQAKIGKIGMFDLQFELDGVEIGIYFRDILAFNQICNLNGVVKRFTTGKHIPASCILGDLQGNEKEFYNFEEVEGGRIIDIYPAVFEKDNLYIGVQVQNLLLNPVILKGEEFVGESINNMKIKLREELIGRYGDLDRTKFNLIKTFPERIIIRLKPELRKQLEEFF